MKVLYTVCEWIMRFAILNILWIAFSILGLGIFGFFPSTMAMFAVVRKWIMGKWDVPIFRTFWEHFKHDFVRSNLIGVIIVILCGFMYTNFKYVELNSSNGLQLTHVPIFVVSITLCLVILYIFPTYVHYHLTFIRYFRNAFIIMFTNPITNIMMIISILIVYYAMSLYPATLFVFGGSVLSYLIMAFCHKTFSRIDKVTN